MKTIIYSAVLATVFILSVVNSFGQTVRLDPRSSKNKINSENNSPIVITIAPSNEIFLGEQSVVLSQIGKKLDSLKDTRTPDNRTVYIKSQDDAMFGKVIQIMQVGRIAQIDAYKLISSDAFEKSDLSKIAQIIIPLERFLGKNKPNPLSLTVTIDQTGNIKLNNSPETKESLSTHLLQVFNEREQNGVFRVGLNEVEKTVFISAGVSTKFGEVVKIIEAIKNSGANPIGLDVDFPLAKHIKITRKK